MEGGKDLQFLELFAGTGRVTRLAKSLGYSSEAHDVIYDKRLEEGYDRNCMDIAGEAGYALLAQELSQYFLVALTSQLLTGKSGPCARQG